MTPIVVSLAVLLSAAAPAAPTAPADALSDVENFGELGLEDLMREEVSVASRTARTLRTSPGIVSVITRAEIQRSGARDLIDVLRNVPGFQFGVDVEGVVGLGVRGVWGHEGKVLLLIDGVEMNEPAYTSTPFGNHYPVENIERIEIVRGPGSVLYGGYAELAVINVVTTAPKDLDGVRLSGEYGNYGDAFGHAAGTAVAAHTFAGGEAGVSAAITLGKANRTDKLIEDAYGDAYDGPGNQTLRPLQLNTALRYRDATLRYIFDDYKTTQQDGFDSVLAFVVPTDFRMHALAADYAAELGGGVVLRPAFRYTWHEPWHLPEAENDPDVPDLSYTGRLATYKASLLADAKPVDRLSLLAGAEYQDQTRRREGYDDERLQSVAGLGEAIYDFEPVSIFAGGRYEHHLTFGDAFVPRAGLTALVGDFHGKLLASQGYRTPSIENEISSYDDLVPERTTVYELELGYQATRNLFVVSNLFQQQIKRPIIYFYDTATEAEGYANQEELGTRGVELEARVKGAPGYLTAGYAYYRPYGSVEDTFETPDGASLLGFSSHKASLNASLDLSSQLSLNPSAEWLSRRWAITSAETQPFGADEDEVAVYEKLPASTLFNVALRYADLGVKDLDVTFAVMNVTDADHAFVQPYDGWHAPMPERGREIVLMADYEVGF